MITIEGNLLAIKQGFICHQVGYQGISTSHLAKGLKIIWPRIYNDYITAFRRGDLKLGEVIFTTVRNNKLYVASLCAQGDENHIDGRSTDYPAVGCCLRKVKDWYEIIGLKRLPIYIPHKMGCDRAGGNWKVVKRIIRREMPNAIIVKL